MLSEADNVFETEESDPTRRPSPFKFLDAYSPEDGALFFGREFEIGELYARIYREPITVVYGESGTGKTSLIQCGLRNRVPPEDMLFVTVRTQLDPETMLHQELGKCAPMTEEEPQQLDTLLRWVIRRSYKTLVLVFDQFEEFFLFQSESVRLSFVRKLAHWVEEGLNLRIIIIIREEYLARLTELEEYLPDLYQNRMRIRRMGRAQAEAAITEPCRVAGVLIEPELVAQLLSTLGSGGEGVELPILQVVLDTLYRQAVKRDRDAPTLTLHDYQELGQVQSILARFLEGRLAAYGPDAEPARQVLKGLVTAEGTRRVASPAEIAELAGAFGNELGEERLVSILHRLVNDRVLREDPERHLFELRHDALAPYIRQWMSGLEQELVEVRQTLDNRLREYRRHGRLLEPEVLAYLAPYENRLNLRGEVAELVKRSRRREERRHKVRMLALAVPLILIICGAAYYSYHWVLPDTVYAKGFVKRWGAVYPVDVVPESTVAHRALTYRFISKGVSGGVHTVEAINSNYQPVPGAITTYLGMDVVLPPRQALSTALESIFDRDKNVIYEVSRDRFGHMTMAFAYSPSPTRTRPITRKATFIGPDGSPQPQRQSQAEFVEIRYDKESGLEVERWYTDLSGDPAPGPDNAYGQRIEYDGKGRVIRLISLDENRTPMNDVVGNAVQEAEYDQDGNITKDRYLDTRGKPTVTASGYAQRTSLYDKWGRIIESRFFDVLGRPTTDMTSGAHRIRWKYDDHGNITSIKLYDRADQATMGGGKVFTIKAHEQRMTYDLRNRIITTAYFDSNGLPVIHPEGWHKLTYEYNKSDFLSAQNYLDANNGPVNLTESGIHRYEWTNNDFGQMREERVFDAAHKPVKPPRSGYHLGKYMYDKIGNTKEVRYFDVDGKTPVKESTTGAHRISYSYNRFGLLVDTRYFNERDEATNNIQGFHHKHEDFDVYGHTTDVKWYDREEHAITGPDGYHHLKAGYDRRGQLLRSSFYDVNNQPAADRRGIHEIINAYNDKRKKTLYQVFGLNHLPTEDENGDHIFRWEFNEAGEQISTTRLRADRGPNYDRELQVATLKAGYNEKGDWEVAYYDHHGRLVVGPGGAAQGVVINEPDGRKTKIFFGVDRKPMLNRLMGFAIKKIDGRTRGDTRDSYHGPDGSLMTGPEGYAEVRRRWDDGGRLLTEAWYDPAGEPVVGPSGYHRAEYVPGAQNKSRYFDVHNHEFNLLAWKTVFPVFFIQLITNLKQPVFNAGVRPGDILWSYGNWSFPDAVAAELRKGTRTDVLLSAVSKQMLAERDRLSQQKTVMTVIRDDKILKITVPPLLTKTLGADFIFWYKAVPTETFENWKMLASR